MYSDFQRNLTELELYDLQEDPEEFDSLSEDPGHRGVLVDLLAQAHSANVALKAPWNARETRS
jgi:hypothetical protein